MPSDQFEFTELEKYTLENAGVVINALASSFNRAGDFLEPERDACEDIVKDKLRSRGYTVAPSPGRVFMPFSRKRGGRTDRLNPQCQLWLACNFSREEKKGRLPGSYGLDIGYYYEATVGPRGYFYFCIYNHAPKQSAFLPPQAFYEGVKKTLPNNYEVDIYPGASGLEIKVTDADASILRKVIEDYRQNVVIPFLDAVP